LIKNTFKPLWKFNKNQLVLNGTVPNNHRDEDNKLGGYSTNSTFVAVAVVVAVGVVVGVGVGDGVVVAVAVAVVVAVGVVVAVAVAVVG
jgi:hypothetical protein